MKVIRYIRVSSIGQADKDGPDRQREKMTAYQLQHKLEFVYEYQELGVSGTMEGMDRPEFRRAIEDAQQEGAAILVERLDRLARDLMVQEIMMRECRKRGIQVFSADQMDLIDIASNEGDPTRKLFRQIMGALAEWERSAMVMKLKMARDRVRAVEGKCGGPSIYGTLHDHEKQALDFIRNMAIRGFASRRIAAALNKEGFLNRQKELWNAEGVKHIISVHKLRGPYVRICKPKKKKFVVPTNI